MLKPLRKILQVIQKVVDNFYDKGISVEPNGISVEPNSIKLVETTLSDEHFAKIVRTRLFYVEGLADGLDDIPRRALRTWVDSVRKLMNKKYPKDIGQ